jgi:hypothetical protein
VFKYGLRCLSGRSEYAITMASVRDVFPFSNPIKIVDVGAMSLGPGLEAYAKLLNAVPCEVIGFEPVPRECEKLNAMKRPGHTYLPYFIGDGTRRTFHECKFVATSSLFEPNTELLAKFQQLGDILTVVGTSEVETKRLDELTARSFWCCRARRSC